MFVAESVERPIALHDGQTVAQHVTVARRPRRAGTVPIDRAELLLLTGPPPQGTYEGL